MRTRPFSHDTVDRFTPHSPVQLTGVSVYHDQCGNVVFQFSVGAREMVPFRLRTGGQSPRILLAGVGGTGEGKGRLRLALGSLHARLCNPTVSKRSSEGASGDVHPIWDILSRVTGRRCDFTTLYSKMTRVRLDANRRRQ